VKRVVALCAVVFSACTPAQLREWQVWHAQDPAAAIAYAEQPDVQAQLADGVGTPAPAPSARWDAIAACESGGRWDYPLVTNRTGTYSGGHMIWTKAWAAYGGHEYAPHAYLASKAEQIVVAERILADNGWGAWDCA